MKYLCGPSPYLAIMFCLYDIMKNSTGRTFSGVQVENGTLTLASSTCPNNWFMYDNLCIHALPTHGLTHNNMDVDMSLEQKVLQHISERLPVIQKLELHSVKLITKSNITKNGNYPMACGSRQFTCKDGHCVSDLCLYDGKPDCPDASDETSHTAVCTINKNGHTSLYCHLCTTDKCKCSPHYFQCLMQGCIHWDRVCNGIPDCTDESDEANCSQRQLKKSYSNSSQTTVHIGYISYPMQDQLLCSKGSNTTFPIYRLCVFDFVFHQGQRYCPYGQHLRNCVDFFCPSMFKCPGSYCVPTRRLCDGVRDCPEGEDEVDNCTGKDIRCPGFFRCRSGVCIHQHEVCDGYVDCEADGDDEAQCHLAPCPATCDCRGGSMICQYLGHAVDVISMSSVRVLSSIISVPILLHGHALINLDLSLNNISIIESDIFENFFSLLYLNISFNTIRNIGKDTFIGLDNIVSMDLWNNKIVNLESMSFQYLSRLQQLYLIKFSIDGNENNLFNGLYTTLRYLDLSYSQLLVMNAKELTPFMRLEMLDITGATIGKFHPWYAYDHIINLKTSEMYLCCQVYFQCKAELGGILHICDANISTAMLITLAVYSSVLITTYVLIIILQPFL